MNENKVISTELTPAELNILTKALTIAEDDYRITETAAIQRAKAAADRGEAYLQEWYLKEAADARSRKEATHSTLTKLTA